MISLLSYLLFVNYCSILKIITSVMYYIISKKSVDGFRKWHTDFVSIDTLKPLLRVFKEYDMNRLVGISSALKKRKMPSCFFAILYKQFF